MAAEWEPDDARLCPRCGAVCEVLVDQDTTEVLAERCPQRCFSIYHGEAST